MKNVNDFKSFVNEEKDYSQWSSKEDHDLAMIRAKWSNSVLAQDVKGMEKYMKEVVKANDAYIKHLKK
tara:strand:+ start:549 stop:752 length:204 start_codon:yes stop_codon:yes gene_type:complete